MARQLDGAAARETPLYGCFGILSTSAYGSWRFDWHPEYRSRELLAKYAEAFGFHTGLNAPNFQRGQETLKRKEFVIPRTPKLSTPPEKP